jgi:hypothetical protein
MERFIASQHGLMRAAAVRRSIKGFAHSGWRVLATTVHNLALQDFAILISNALLTAVALLVAQGPAARQVQLETSTLLCLMALMLVLTRGEVIEASAVRAATYRLGLLGATSCSYLVLRKLLPALHPTLLDAKLIAIDGALFGATPSIWLDRYVTVGRVEWFAFFYYSHYWLLTSYLIGTLLFDQGRRRYELLLGASLSAAIGHSIYLLVPGIGPYASSSLSFVHPLLGGVWWARVNVAVASAGAGLDIFPSMHTELSLLIGLHAFRYRHQPPLTWTWLLTCACVGNIIIATLFLRWHYGVDVLAGGLLAIGIHRLAIKAWHWEAARVERTGRQRVWEPVLPTDMRPEDRRWLTGIAFIHITVLIVLLSGVM